MSHSWIFPGNLPKTCSDLWSKFTCFVLFLAESRVSSSGHRCGRIACDSDVSKDSQVGYSVGLQECEALPQGISDVATATP